MNTHTYTENQRNREEQRESSTNCRKIGFMIQFCLFCIMIPSFSFLWRKCCTGVDDNGDSVADFAVRVER